MNKRHCRWSMFLISMSVWWTAIWSCWTAFFSVLDSVDCWWCWLTEDVFTAFVWNKFAHFRSSVNTANFFINSSCTLSSTASSRASRVFHWLLLQFLQFSFTFLFFFYVLLLPVQCCAWTEYKFTCVYVSVCHTFCQLAYMSDPSTDFYS